MYLQVRLLSILLIRFRYATAPHFQILHFNNAELDANGRLAATRLDVAAIHNFTAPGTYQCTYPGFPYHLPDARVFSSFGHRNNNTKLDASG